MVQCFSGGFANVIFEGGDPEKGLAAHSRAGFFATVNNRLAAGCTALVKSSSATLIAKAMEFFTKMTVPPTKETGSTT